MVGDAMSAVTMASTAENAWGHGPHQPRWAVIDKADAKPMAPTPTGLMSYR